jgi:hypothetical protein
MNTKPSLPVPLKTIVFSVYQKYFNFWAIYIYIVTNFLFNFRYFFSQILDDSTHRGSIFGEVWMFEWLTEKFYEKMVSSANPFAAISGIIYPFQIQLGATDAGYGLFLWPFKYLLSTHQALFLIIPLSTLLACFGMYFLMKKVGIRREISFLVGLAFGNMTFLIPRLGHLNYWCIFVFPWFYYCLMSLFKSKRQSSRALFALGMSVFFSLTLWLNFYYFVILCSSIVFLGLYYCLKQRSVCMLYLRQFWTFGFMFLVFVGIFQIQWIIALVDWIRFDQLPVTPGFGGAIEYSSDLINYFIPSAYGYYTDFIGKYIGKHFIFASHIFEDFTYPGVIILVVYGIYIWQWVIKKKLSFHHRAAPLFWTGIFFVILTLGPFLHIFGKWGILVDDNIRLVFPLPYLGLKYLPFFNNIRVPGRLVVGFIFFAYWVVGLWLNQWSKRFSAKKMFFVTAMIILIVIIDQRYKEEVAPTQVFPWSLYQRIAQDNADFSVFPVPFTIRDGFTYFGDYQATTAHVAESIHHKPMIGGYTGRIADYKKDYYRNDALLGYIGRLIDENKDTNPTVDKQTLSDWTSLDYTKARETIDFLDIKYVVANDLQPYSASISSILKQLGYQQTKKEVGYTLWMKPLISKEFLTIDMSSPSANLSLGMGWDPPNGNKRFMTKNASVMFKITKIRPMTLIFSANSTSNQQKLTVYINKIKLKSIDISTDEKNYSIEIPPLIMAEGINTVHFQNQQNESIQFSSITLEDKNTAKEL